MPDSPPDPRSPKDAWDEQHRLLAANPVAWVLKADALIAAFETLAAQEEQALKAGDDSPNLSGVTYMVAGFAVEVLLKALLIQTMTPVSEKGWFQVRSHRLLELVNAVGFSIVGGEARLLEKLEQFLTWAGRYPIPLTSEPMRPRTTPSGGFAPRTFGNLGEDWQEVRALISRLKDLLPQINYEQGGV